MKKNDKFVWNNIWDERAKNYPEDDPIKLGGWDQSFSLFSTSSINQLINLIKNKLDLQPKDKLFELGCGGCMLLSILSKYVSDSFGSDLSYEMIKRAKKLFPYLKLIQSDSINLPFSNKQFNKILIHSVIQYFPDYSYTEKVFDELLRISKSSSRILISDVMDISKKSEYIKLRKRLEKSTNQLWKTSIGKKSNHLYFSQNYFKTYAENKGLLYDIQYRNISGYMNSKYRFDVLYIKK